MAELVYCDTCGAPMGPDGMVEVCKAFSGELCVECCGCPDHEGTGDEEDGET
jgi:hypothetical protein